MHPELFSLGPVTLYTYGVFLAASYVLGLQLARARARRWDLDGDRVLDLGIYLIIGALVGAKVLLVVVDADRLQATSLSLVSLARSAGVFYGGLLAALGVAFWYIPRHGLPLWTTCDVFAPAVALGHVTGRLGCFAAGCCYGKPTSVPGAVTFTSPLAAANVGTPLGVALHPTQLYEAAAELLILMVLIFTERRGRRFAGRTFWAYLLLCAVSRFVIEIYRGDPRGTVLSVLSTSQFVSLLLGPLSAVMMVYLARASRGPVPATPAGTAS